MDRGGHLGRDGLVDRKRAGVILGGLAVIAFMLFHIPLGGLLLLLALPISCLVVSRVAVAEFAFSIEARDAMNGLMLHRLIDAWQSIPRPLRRLLMGVGRMLLLSMGRRGMRLMRRRLCQSGEGGKWMCARLRGRVEGS